MGSPMSSNKTNDVQNILLNLYSDFQCKNERYILIYKYILCIIYKMTWLNLLV